MLLDPPADSSSPSLFRFLRDTRIHIRAISKAGKRNPGRGPSIP